MSREQANFLFLNLGHFFDHLIILVFATAAALHLHEAWSIPYPALIPYATPGFIAFGVCAIPAGWLPDKWSREGMMVIFFIGIGSSAILAAFSTSPIQMSLCLTLIGVFAAVYHPVGLAMVVEGRDKLGVPVAINGIFGNMGVASAALLTGFLIDNAGWRFAFAVPGGICIATGLGYFLFVRSGQIAIERRARTAMSAPRTVARFDHRKGGNGGERKLLIRVFSIIFFTTAIGDLIFQSTTFSLPKVLDERLSDLAGTATLVGWYAFMVFSVAAFAQLLVGYLIDRYSVRLVFAFVALAQAVGLAAMTQMHGVWALLVALGFMLAVFGQIPINDVLVGRMARSEWRSRAYALRYIVTFSVSATAVPLIAWIYGGRGFAALFGILAGCAVVIFTAALMLPGREARSGELTAAG